MTKTFFACTWPAFGGPAAFDRCFRRFASCWKTGGGAPRTLPNLMKKPTLALLWLPLCLSGLLCSPLPVLGQATLISTGAVWKYLDTGADLTAANWQALDYNDATWLS